MCNFVGLECKSKKNKVRMKLYKVILGSAACLFAAVPSFAQGQPSNEEMDKQLYEIIQNQVEKFEEHLDLEDWQVFYVDSIMVHDYNAMQSELRAMSESKISNADAYTNVQDKWMDQMYNSFQKLFTEDQWAKYLKTGAARDKRARDKRMAKAIK